MKLKFYGTGAAEAIPALFCSCPVCEHARKVKGREIRTRHSSTVDGVIQFDLGPDFFYHIHCLGLEPRAIKHLIITHAHSDHFSPNEIGNRKDPYTLTGAAETQLIGNAYTLAQVKKIAGENEELNIRPVEAVHYRQIVLDEQTTLTPLPANHAPAIGGTIYLLERGGKRLLYAHDTGPLFPEVLDWLAGRQLDAVSLDCTGAYLGAGQHHMQLSSCEDTVGALHANGGLKQDGICVINHFSHGGGATCEQLIMEAKKRGWIAAYDGLEIEI